MAITDAQRKAKAKYEAKAYDKILLRIRTDGDITRKSIQRAANCENKTVNQYILDCIRAYRGSNI